MTEDYSIIARPGDGILRTTHPKFGLNLWARSKLRKPFTCKICDSEYEKGATGFLPITHGYNRMHRICGRCAEYA